MDDKRLVVRLHDPRRLRVLLVAALAALLLLGFGSYELGHRAGGQSSFKSDQKRKALRAELARLKVEGQQLRDELARARTSLEVDREAQAWLRENLADSEQRLAELHEELEFYRRIVVPPEGQTGLRVQTFEIAPGSLPHSYRLRLLLVQNPQRSGRAQGHLHVSLRGVLDGEEASLPLESLAAEPPEFEFLYFQDLDVEVFLPEGFVPEAAEVELRPRNARGVEASFPWKPRA